MNDSDTIWSLIGIKLSNLTGGTAGGMAAAILYNRSGVIAILGTVTLGALTAAYMTDLCAQYVGNLGGGIAFVVGLCAMAICQKIVEFTKKWTIPKGE